MNGFEPLHRRIIDYTAAGQWQEVYDGPVEKCEEYGLKAENAKLRELCASLYEFAMSEYPDGAELNFADRIHELGVK